MDSERRRRVFDPFFTTKPAGHGLGMAAVLGIIRYHGGAISIESTPGGGTCVRVVLPLVEAPVASYAADGRSERPAPLASGCVLVVDDEPAVRRIARVALESSGYAVIEAGDGEEALATFRRVRAGVSAVLLDMTMPRLSGSETLRQLRGLAPDLPVLLMSGFAEEEFSATDTPGRTAFLAKPFRVAELRARLARLVAGARALR
jgi:CheY-like chemotaxis protein